MKHRRPMWRWEDAAVRRLASDIWARIDSDHFGDAMERARRDYLEGRVAPFRHRIPNPTPTTITTGWRSFTARWDADGQYTDTRS